MDKLDGYDPNHPLLAPRADDTPEQRGARKALADAVRRRAELRGAYEIAAILDREATDSGQPIPRTLALYRSLARDAVSRELSRADEAVHEYLGELREAGGASCAS